jgi:exodeoxyribonuclease-3
MRLASWNVNSIRSRVERVVEFLDREDVDVLAMQETKCRPDQFPIEAFASAGYDVACHGLHQFNGVAIASRVGLDDATIGFPDQPSFGKTGEEAVVEARAIGATCDGVRVWSVYVPNGRALDDPHYPYKLAFLEALSVAAASWSTDPVAIVGDWNVAPLDEDVWDPGFADLATHVSPDVRRALATMTGVGYAELTRRFLPAPQTYTYWDYQRLRFPRNEGMRIDYVYASPPLAARAMAATIHRDERKGKGASDHVPVVVDFDPPAGTVVS